MNKLDIVAMSGEAMQVMLSDGTLLAIRAKHGADGREVENWDDAVSFLVVDHRTVPGTLINIPCANVDYAPEA